MPATGLRDERARLLDDDGLRGAEFGRALSDSVDRALGGLLAEVDVPCRWALVALGSYARRELCPGSDVDVMFLHDGRGAIGEAVNGLWYPLWDAGLVLGHSARTIKEAIALGDGELEALTALLDTRVLGGDAALCDELTVKARRLAQRRRRRVVEGLATAADVRVEHPGPIAEMLEPNLKDGSGGLRDVQALAWAGWSLGDDGMATLVDRGYLQLEDADRLAAGHARLLDVRVALHRVTGSRSDVLALQDQDAVAERLGVHDADVLVREVASAGRAISWVAADAWSRLRAAERGPMGRLARRDRRLADGVVLRDGRVHVDVDATVDTALVLRAAAAAAQHGADLERGSLERFRLELGEPVWGGEERNAFITVLRAGRGAVTVLEALDHVGVLVRLLPEWERVRSLPQRNAYHRFTVDRHLLEAVAQCAALLDEEGIDGDVARRARPDVLLLGALLHDIGKGLPEDHSAVGAAMARTVADRIELDGAGIDSLAWLVERHLLLAETATRRDLSEEATVMRFGRAVGHAERLDLLYALTLGDSRATGPAAWNPTKAALVRELFLKTDALLERGVVESPLATRRRRELRQLIGAEDADAYLDAMPAAYTAAFSAEVAAHHRQLVLAGRLRVEWSQHTDGRYECTVVAPDRTGLLATVAGVLSLSGFDIQAAAGYSHRAGMALEVFTGVDRFHRLGDTGGRERVEQMLRDALRGALPLEEQLRERADRYRRPASPAANGVEVLIDQDASDFATVVEVHAPDEVGLLARVAAVFADLALDVSLALVATLAERVVDVFYVRDAFGDKVDDPAMLERLRTALDQLLIADLTPS
jgi:[protein-PII] uridylyltransferase